MKYRLLSCIFSICLLISSLALPAYAVGGTIDTGTMVPSYSVEEIAVVNAVELYFAQRELILTAQNRNLDAISDWYQQDELKHFAEITKTNVNRIDSTILIENICLGDYTTVSLQETITYNINGNSYTEVIEHELILIGANNTFTVIDDAYYEQATNFASCSYIPANLSSTLATGDGSSRCIIQVARNEMGYVEGSGGYTKYGDWFELPYGEWCVMFVSWCANKADIPTSIISKQSGTGHLHDFFMNKNSFTLSPNLGGNPTPQAEDIIFFRGKDKDGDGEPDNFTGHVGIVTGYSGSTVSYIDGNGYPEYNCVKPRSISLYADIIVGFGRPQYSKNNHTSVSWQSNSNQHWKTCENCNSITVQKAAHTMYTEPITGITYCTICNYGRSVDFNRIKNEPIILDS